jgi:predicted oxidoreductase
VTPSVAVAVVLAALALTAAAGFVLSDANARVAQAGLTCATLFAVGEATGWLGRGFRGIKFGRMFLLFLVAFTAHTAAREYGRAAG